MEIESLTLFEIIIVIFLFSFNLNLICLVRSLPVYSCCIHVCYPGACMAVSLFFIMCMNMATWLLVWRLYVNESQTVINHETTKENKSHCFLALLGQTSVLGHNFCGTRSSARKQSIATSKIRENGQKGPNWTIKMEHANLGHSRTHECALGSKYLIRPMH